MLEIVKSMPNGVRVLMLFGLTLLAGVGLTLPLVVSQAVEAPISALGLLWMLLLAYLVFTLTLILQRKQAAWMLSIGLASLSIPVAIALYFWSPPTVVVGIAVALVLFYSLRRPSVRAWFSEE